MIMRVKFGITEASSESGQQQPGKVLSVQTIKLHNDELQDAQGSLVTARIRIEGDRLIYLGCRRQAENRTYETEL
eukprot:CAMPEP_0185592032 /NCGR_PEP_ID=MMETSP0434-20130131/66613_1 /TAXON_ID=626734 ORGANISM="Favella taraikaensis, Strain Fe Narragansett Bay" /NCGR_SAMPLE_ID=MMETSP0434 /ASSEMBLY_ACC=CAM_ASM_000379 /LENGTH=74 /DNA_ID=CAMNT_0028217525 /DNA_START=270 /DNA_END=494 /DNA_ORIENTATION=+